jgi:hypothetical protein
MKPGTDFSKAVELYAPRKRSYGIALFLEDSTDAELTKRGAIKAFS